MPAGSETRVSQSSRSIKASLVSIRRFLGGLTHHRQTRNEGRVDHLAEAARREDDGGPEAFRPHRGKVTDQSN